MNKLISSFMTTTFIASAVFAQAANTTTTAAAPTSGISTTTVAAPSKIKGSFTHVSSKAIKEDPTASKVDTQNVLGVSYKPEDVTYGVSQKVTYSIVGAEQKAKDTDTEFMKQSDAKATFKDLKLSAGKTFGSLGSSDPVTVKGVLYAPTSNASKNANQYSALAAEVYIPYTLTNGFSTQLAFFPIYSIKKGDDKFFNESYGEVRYSFTDKLSTYAGLYHDYTAANAVKRSAEVLTPELGVDVSFPKIVDLTFAINQTRNILNPTEDEDTKRKSFALLAPEETSLAVQAVFQF
jgi:hypothetical protein